MAMIVSKSLPMVSIVTSPVAGAVHVHQTECTGGVGLAWSGPPDFTGAPTVVAGAEATKPESGMALARSSLTGAEKAKGTEISREPRAPQSTRTRRVDIEIVLPRDW